MGKLKLKDFKNLALITQMALIMIIPIFFGVWFGRWLDNKFQTGNIFLLVMTIVGVITAFLNLYKYSIRAMDDGSEKDE